MQIRVEGERQKTKEGIKKQVRKGSMRYLFLLSSPGLNK